MSYKENPNYNQGRRKANYSNSHAVENVIRYVTRSRMNENRGQDLIAYGGAGVNLFGTPELMINQFLCVQRVHNIEVRKGRRLYHEVFLLSDKEYLRLCQDMNQVNALALKICNLYYQMGHQVVYAIHYEPDKRLHIHFVYNAINFLTGKKWHENKYNVIARERLFNEMLRDHQCIIIKKVDGEISQPL